MLERRFAKRVVGIHAFDVAHGERERQVVAAVGEKERFFKRQTVGGKRFAKANDFPVPEGRPRL